MSVDAVSSLMAYWRAISQAISDSAHPFPRESRINAPAALRRNIWPWSISRTIPPSSLRVLRTPAEMSYKAWVLPGACREYPMKRRHEARLCVKCSQDGPDLVALHVFNGCCGHLNASDHVAANDGQERNWISSDVRPELFLEYPKQVAFWQISFEEPEGAGHPRRRTPCAPAW